MKLEMKSASLVFTVGQPARLAELKTSVTTQRGASTQRWWDFKPETLQRFFPFTTHTESRSNYPCDNAHSARWARM